MGQKIMEDDFYTFFEKDIILNGESDPQSYYDKEIDKKTIENSNNVRLIITWNPDPLHINILESEYDKKIDEAIEDEIKIFPEIDKIYFIQDKDGTRYIQDSLDSLIITDISYMTKAINILTEAQLIIESQS